MDGISNETIAEQTERAIQYWNESKVKHPDDMTNQVHDDVMKHLQRGTHLSYDICRPPNERLFPTQRACECGRSKLRYDLTFCGTSVNGRVQ